MKKSNISEFIKEIEDLTARIWEKPPSEIKKMKDTEEIVFMRPFFKINYSFHNLRALLEELATLRECARNGVLIDYLRPVTISFIESKCSFQKAIGLDDTLELLRKACEILKEVNSKQEYLEIIDKLFIYLGKMSDKGWLDLEMHWSEVSSAYDIIDSLK